MAKVSYSQAEEAFDRSVKQLTVNILVESAIWSHLILGTESHRGDSPTRTKVNKIIEHILSQSNALLNLFKNKNAKFYEELHITPAEEQKFAGSAKDLTKEDWKRLKELIDTMIEYRLAKSQNGGEPKPEDLTQIEEQQKEHLHKRYNVKKGWLPL